MKKLDFNKPLANLDGTAREDVNLGKVLAEIMASENKQDFLKFMNWALKIYNKESIEVDPSDEQLLKDYIKNHENMTILLKFRLMECFN